MKLVAKVHSDKLMNEVRDSKFVQKSLLTEEPILKEDGEADSLQGGDVYINKYSEDCAYMSAGASVECCSQVFEKKSLQRAFANIRPPGHHASCGRVAGFCLLNNAAIAAKYL